MRAHSTPCIFEGVRWGVILLLAGCGSVREPIALPEAASSILAIEAADRFDVFAIDGDGDGIDSLPIFDAYSGVPVIELSVHSYDVPLERLSLVPGLIVPDPSAGTTPNPASSARRVIDERGDGDWLPGAQEKLASFHGAGFVRSKCTGFEARNVKLEGAADPVIALLGDGDDVLAITSSPDIDAPGTSDLWRARFTDPPSVERLQPSGLDALRAIGRVVTATRSSDGRIWLSVASDRSLSETWVGTPDGGFAPLPRQRTTRRAEWAWWMAIEERPEGVRLWTLGDGGSVNRYDDATQTWTNIQTGRIGIGSCASPTRLCGGITVGVDGVAVFIDTRDFGHIYRVRDDDVASESFPDESVDGDLTTVRNTPLGVALVQSSALSTSVLVRKDDRWAAITDAMGRKAFSTQRAFAIGPWGNGWILSGAFGYVLQVAGEEVCGIVDAVAPGQNISFFASTPIGFAMAEGNHAAGLKTPPEIAMVRPTR